MNSAVSGPANILGDMGKNKPNGKKDDASTRKATRVNVGLPEEWHAIARRLAAKRRQPVTFLIIDLLNQAAEAEKIDDLPNPPWEEVE